MRRFCVSRTKIKKNYVFSHSISTSGTNKRNDCGNRYFRVSSKRWRLVVAFHYGNRLHAVQVNVNAKTTEISHVNGNKLSVSFNRSSPIHTKPPCKRVRARALRDSDSACSAILPSPLSRSSFAMESWPICANQCIVAVLSDAACALVGHISLARVLECRQFFFHSFSSICGDFGAQFVRWWMIMDEKCNFLLLERKRNEIEIETFDWGESVWNADWPNVGRFDEMEWMPNKPTMHIEWKTSKTSQILQLRNPLHMPYFAHVHHHRWTRNCRRYIK